MNDSAAGPRVTVACAHCGRLHEKLPGHVNRARKQGMKLFCGRRCMGLAKRTGKTKLQRVKEKRLYDAEYRRKNRALLKEKKAAYFRQTYDPAKAAVERKKRMPRHVEYCRQPKYKAYKREYDRQYRAKEYGPFAEAYMLAIDLNREIKQRMSNHEIYQANGRQSRQARARAATEEGARDRHRSAQRV